MSVSVFPAMRHALQGDLGHSGSAGDPSRRTRHEGARRWKPAVGMNVTFTAEGYADLAGIPAAVRYVWPRFRSGEYLVTLEYSEPVQLGRTWIRHIDAFSSELEPLVGEGARPPASVLPANHSMAPRTAPHSRAA